MPFTVITLNNVPRSLRGDLSKWMQEIAVGVYVGNFNSRVREQLWKRVCDNVSHGEATISYSSRNELGYSFDTYQTKQEVIDSDGIPLICYATSARPIPKSEKRHGFSDAYRFHISHKKQKLQTVGSLKSTVVGEIPYVIIDLETDGLDEQKSHIIEIGAVKVSGQSTSEFHTLIKTEDPLPQFITELTGLRDQDLHAEGITIEEAVNRFENFVGPLPLVGYNIQFDLKFLKKAFERVGKAWKVPQKIDILSLVRKEKTFLDNYKFERVLASYGIRERVPHRALCDVRLMQKLILKLNGFEDLLEKSM